MLSPPMEQVAVNLNSLEAQVVRDLKFNLVQRIVGLWHLPDDDLFASHTSYASQCWQIGLPERASRLWEEVLTKEVESAEAVLGRQVPPDRIHKGAPLYNAGLGYLLAGNLDRAVALISSAGAEEAKRGTGQGCDLLLGSHELTEKSVLTPIVGWIISTGWDKDFVAITSRQFDMAELKSLLGWLGQKVENAIQLIACLWRLRLMASYPLNEATRHLRVQGYADLLLIVESSLRTWQTSPTLNGKQLYNRLENMLGANQRALTAFKSAEARFAAQFPKDPVTKKDHPDKETAIAVNWVIGDTLSLITNATSPAERAGYACHLAARLRNSLMHVIDGSVDLYGKDVEFNRVAGITLSVIRLSQSGHDGSITGLPTA